MVTKVRGASSQNFTSRADMKAYDAPVGAVLYLNDGGRSGEFAVKSGTPPSDPQEGVYVVLDNGNYAERRGIVTPYAFGVVDGQESTTELNAFFRFIGDYETSDVDASCDTLVSGQVAISAASGQFQTKYLRGITRVTATTAIDTVVKFDDFGQVYWSGGVVVTGTGGATYSSRGCRVGIEYSGSQSGRSNFDVFEASNFWETGVYFLSFSTYTKVSRIDCFNCGPGNTAASKLEANYSAATNSGVDTSTSQRGTITVDTLPSEDVSTEIFVVIGGRVHYVYSIDRVLSELTVYPKIDTSGGTSGVLTYAYGGAVSTTGSDTGVLQLDAIDSSNNSFGLFMGALYGPNIGSLVAQADVVGLAYGRTPSTANQAFNIDSYYAEINTFDVLSVSSASQGGVIATIYDAPNDGIEECASPRNASGTSLSPFLSGLTKITIGYRGKELEFKRQAYGVLASTPSIDVSDPQNNTSLLRKNSGGISLLFSDVSFGRLFGINTARLSVVGTGTSGEPTGTIDFTPGSPASATVNGAASASFSGFTKPADFVVIYDFDTNDYLVYES